MEKKTMLEMHTIEENDAFLVLTLGDDKLVIRKEHLDTVKELCEYLDCLTMMITLVSSQNDCINKQADEIEKLKGKVESYKTCNEILRSKNDYLKKDNDCLEARNGFNDQCRQMTIDNLKKKVEELAAEKKSMAQQIDNLLKARDDTRSVLARIRDVAAKEHEARVAAEARAKDLHDKLFVMTEDRNEWRSIVENVREAVGEE